MSSAYTVVGDVMIEIKPLIIEKERCLGILIYLPKCTVRMIMNMKIICLDDSFDLYAIEKRCPVPLIGCASASFDKMLDDRCTAVSDQARALGINEMMNVKEAIACAVQSV